MEETIKKLDEERIEITRVEEDKVIIYKKALLKRKQEIEEQLAHFE